MNRSASRVMVRVAGLAVLGMTATLAGAQAAGAQPAAFTFNDVMPAPFAWDTTLRKAARALTRFYDAAIERVVITPLGRSRIARAAKEWDAVQARVVAHIGRRRWERLSASLLEIAEQVRTWTPEEIT
jgi:hypothetical protein